MLTRPSQYVVSVGRRSNHWMGTAKMGADDGRSGGTAVVDTNNKVYGTDNLFVMDASIFPGMMTGNPSAMIVIASEHAAERIMALKVVAAAEPEAKKEPAGQMEAIEIESPPEVEFEFGDD
jgi:choline dehydrogenase-like flavoprotein